MRRLMLFVALVAIGHARMTVAQCTDCAAAAFDATDGLPDDVCWNVHATGAGTPQNNGSYLQISSSGTEYAYERIRPSFEWSDGHSIEARIRVPVGGSSCCGFRAAAFFVQTDMVGRVVSLYAWSGGIAFSTDQSLVPGPGLLLIEMDMTTVFRTFTITSDADGVVLWIDGVQAASLPYTSIHPSARNIASFGNDTRTTGPGITQWEYVRFSRIAGCDADRDCDGDADSSDFLAYLNDWSTQEPAADLAPPGSDGNWDSSDFLAYLNLYSQGC